MGRPRLSGPENHWHLGAVYARLGVGREEFRLQIRDEARRIRGRACFVVHLIFQEGESPWQ